MNEPLKDKKKNRFPSYPEVTFFDSDIIKSACEWLKDRLGNECDKEVEEAFPDIYEYSETKR